jgi:hypothetical protein
VNCLSSDDCVRIGWGIVGNVDVQHEKPSGDFCRETTKGVEVRDSTQETILQSERCSEPRICEPRVIGYQNRTANKRDQRTFAELEANAEVGFGYLYDWKGVWSW